MVYGSDVDMMCYIIFKIYFMGQIDLVIFYEFVVLRFCGGIFVVFYFSVFVLIDVISGYFFDVSFRLCVLVYYNDVI